MPKSKTALPKYRQLNCVEVMKMYRPSPLCSEISLFFSFSVCPAASARLRDVWLSLGARKEEERHVDPWSTSSHALAGPGPHRIRLQKLYFFFFFFLNVADGRDGCGSVFSVTCSQAFGEVQPRSG